MSLHSLLRHVGIDTAAGIAVGGRRISEAPACSGAANLRGEHIPCDNDGGHDGWPHGNRQHGLIWDA